MNGRSDARDGGVELISLARRKLSTVDISHERSPPVNRKLCRIVSRRLSGLLALIRNPVPHQGAKPPTGDGAGANRAPQAVGTPGEAGRAVLWEGAGPVFLGALGTSWCPVLSEWGWFGGRAPADIFSQTGGPAWSGGLSRGSASACRGCGPPSGGWSVGGPRSPNGETPRFGRGPSPTEIRNGSGVRNRAERTPLSRRRLAGTATAPRSRRHKTREMPFG